MFESGSRIIRDGGKLAFEYVPDRVVCRDVQMKELEVNFRPLVSGGRPCSSFLTGGVGTGKTVTAKRFVADMASYLNSHGGTMDSVYVNCRIRNSEYTAILDILRHFDPGCPDRGFSAEEMLQSIGRHVASGARPFVVILDEADSLLRNNGRNIIYQLSRFSESLSGRASLSLMIISQTSISGMLDEASISTFRRGNTVRFNLYSRDELRQIVAARAELALYPGVISGECLDLVASLAEGYGDARFAIEVLERAANIAEGEGGGTVTADNVRTAGAMIYSDVSESKLEDLALQRMISLLAISRAMKGMPHVTLTAAEKTYAVVCEEYGQPARKHTQFWTYVQDMERSGLLTTEVRREVDGGRTTYISMENIPPREMAKKLEYIIDAKGYEAGSREFR